MTNAFTPASAFDFRTDMYCASGRFRLARFPSRVFLAVRVRASGSARRRRTQARQSFSDAAEAVPGLLPEPEYRLLETGQSNPPDISSPPGDFN
jgi:hypothetical protein